MPRPHSNSSRAEGPQDLLMLRLLKNAVHDTVQIVDRRLTTETTASITMNNLR